MESSDIFVGALVVLFVGVVIWLVLKFVVNPPKPGPKPLPFVPPPSGFYPYYPPGHWTPLTPLHPPTPQPPTPPPLIPIVPIPPMIPIVPVPPLTPLNRVHCPGMISTYDGPAGTPGQFVCRMNPVTQADFIKTSKGDFAVDYGNEGENMMFANLGPDVTSVHHDPAYPRKNIWRIGFRGTDQVTGSRDSFTWTPSLYA